MHTLHSTDLCESALVTQQYRPVGALVNLTKHTVGMGLQHKPYHCFHVLLRGLLQFQPYTKNYLLLSKPDAQCVASPMYHITVPSAVQLGFQVLLDQIRSPISELNVVS